MGFCTNCKYYFINPYCVGGNDWHYCKHPTNLETKNTTVLVKNTLDELNSDNNCKNYRFSILKYLFG